MDEATMVAGRDNPCLANFPTDVLIEILGSCKSFTDLLAMIVTCRRFYAVWRRFTPLIIWHVGQTAIPAFRGALLAVSSLILKHSPSPATS